MMDRKALILGIKGTKLLKSETNLIRREKPWGIILFSRNIKITQSQFQKVYAEHSTQENKFSKMSPS